MGQQGEYNIPPDDDENEDYGGALPLPQVPRGMLAILPTLSNRGVSLPSSESGDSSFPLDNKEILPESLADDDIYVPDVIITEGFINFPLLLVMMILGPLLKSQR